MFQLEGKVFANAKDHVSNLLPQALLSNDFQLSFGSAFTFPSSLKLAALINEQFETGKFWMHLNFYCAVLQAVPSYHCRLTRTKTWAFCGLYTATHLEVFFHCTYFFTTAQQLHQRLFQMLLLSGFHIKISQACISWSVNTSIIWITLKIPSNKCCQNFHSTDQ